MGSVDVPVALLGYGTVGSAVNRLLTESADDIERATGHRLRVVRALVRDTGKERDYPAAAGVLTSDVRAILDDPDIAVVAEVMGGVEPTGDVSGADSAAKMAILATVAFKSRVELADVEYSGIDSLDPLDVAAARKLDMAIRLVGAARLVDGQVDVRVQPALVDRHHPLAGVEGPFNAVMLQGDAIREITLEGPGAGGIETASAVVADMVNVIGTMD